MAEGRLASAELPSEVVIERPKNRDHGDWATNVAMQSAGRFGLKPREFAELLAAELEAIDGVAKVDIAGPGFINLTLSAAAAGELAKAIVEAGAFVKLGWVGGDPSQPFAEPSWRPAFSALFSTRAPPLNA